MEGKWIRRWKILASAGFLTASAGLLPSTESLAVFDESLAVHIKTDDIEDSVLVIGTHLIYLGALTDQLYETAVTSAGDSAQGNIYYKSEFSDHRWYLLDGSGALSDIKKDEKAVDKSVIESLYMTHYTKADGITYDLRTGNAVNAFDITDPYDFLEIPELRPLADQYSNLLKSGESGGIIDLLKEFFETETDEEEVKERNKTVEMLYHSYIRLLSGGGDLKDQKEALYSVMEKADDERRGKVLERARSLLNGVGETAASMQGQDEISGIIQECLIDMELNISEQKEDEKDTAVLSQAEKQLAQEVTEAAENEDDGKLKESLNKYTCLTDLTKGRYQNQEELLDFLNETLIPIAVKCYEENGDKVAEEQLKLFREMKENLEAGQDGAGQEEADVEKLENQLDELKEQRLEALGEQNLEEGQELKEQMSSIQKQIEELGGGTEKKERFKELERTAAESIEEGQAGLTALDAGIEAYSVLGAAWPKETKNSLEIVYKEVQKASEQESLESPENGEEASDNYERALSRIEEILEQCRQSLTQESKNKKMLEILDTAGGMKLDGENPRKDASGILGLAIYNGQAQAVEPGKKGTGGTGAGGTGGSETGSGGTGSGGTGAGGIGSGGTGDSGTGAGGTGGSETGSGGTGGSGTGTGGTGAGGAANSGDKTNGTGSSGNGTDSTGGSGTGSGGTGGSETGSGGAGSSGTGQEEAGPGDGTQGSDGAEEPAGENEAVSAMIEEKALGFAGGTDGVAGYIFKTEIDTRAGETETYVPADVLADFIHFRYIWNRKQKQVILARGNTFYRFEAFSDIVEKEGDKTEELSADVRFSKVLYIPAEYVMQEFDCQIYKIAGTDYIVLADKEILKEAEEIAGTLSDWEERGR